MGHRIDLHDSHRRCRDVVVEDRLFRMSHYNDDYDAEPWQNDVNLDAHNRAMEAQMSGVVCELCLRGTNDATTPTCVKAGCPGKGHLDSQIHRYGRQQAELVAGAHDAAADDRAVQKLSK